MTNSIKNIGMIENDHVRKLFEVFDDEEIIGYLLNNPKVYADVYEAFEHKLVVKAERALVKADPFNIRLIPLPQPVTYMESIKYNLSNMYYWKDASNADYALASLKYGEDKVALYR